MIASKQPEQHEKKMNTKRNLRNILCLQEAPGIEPVPLHYGSREACDFSWAQMDARFHPAQN
jgi:hypothetical protein